jgi:hypothetical protein
MNAKDVTRDEIEAYALGDISDPEVLERIEEALETDDQAAQWYEQVQKRLEPSTDARQQVGEMFKSLDRSQWVRIQWADGDGGESNLRRATIELPEGQIVALRIRNVEDGLQLEFDELPADLKWRPASVALFAPTQRAGEPLVSISTTAAGKGAAHTVKKIAAHTAEHTGAVAWRSPPLSNLQGAEAWLENTTRGLAIVVRMPTELAPLSRAAYRLTWQDPETEQEDSRQGLVELNLNEGGRRVGRVHMRLPLSTLLQSSAWQLRVQPLGPDEAACLTSRELRAVAGESYHTLPLSAASDDAHARTLTARFRTETQRRLWSDGQACHMIRFEPTS